MELTDPFFARLALVRRSRVGVEVVRVDQRDTLFGDLHNITIEVAVIEGNGSVIPFVVVTDIASGDSNVIVQ